MWDLIVSVPDHCLSFYLAISGYPMSGLDQKGHDHEAIYYFWYSQTVWEPKINCNTNAFCIFVQGKHSNITYHKKDKIGKYEI